MCGKLEYCPPTSVPNSDDPDSLDCSLKPELYNDSWDLSQCPRIHRSQTSLEDSHLSHHAVDRASNTPDSMRNKQYAKRGPEISAGHKRGLRPAKSWRKPVPPLIAPGLPSYSTRRFRSSWNGGRPGSVSTFQDGPWNRPGGSAGEKPDTLPYHPATSSRPVGIECDAPTAASEKDNDHEAVSRTRTACANNLSLRIRLRS